jgi:hypothetical protein
MLVGSHLSPVEACWQTVTRTGGTRLVGIPPVAACHGVREATNSLAGSVVSVLVNIVRNVPPAGASPT